MEFFNNKTYADYVEEVENLQGSRYDKYKYVINQLMPSLTKNVANNTAVMKFEFTDLLYEYVWECEGRYILQITPEVIEFANLCNFEGMTSKFMLPRDVVVFNFPKGTMIRDFPLRSVMIGRSKSAIFDELVDKIGVDVQKKGEHTFYSCDFGEDINGKHTWDMIEPSIKSMVNITNDSELNSIKDLKLDIDEKSRDAVMDASMLCVKILLLARSKPEFVEDIRIKSKPNKRFPKTVKRISLPKIYIDHIRSIKSGRSESGDRSSPKPFQGLDLENLMG